MSLPLTVGNRLVGVMNVTEPEGRGTFSEDDRNLGLVMAQHGALGLVGAEGMNSTRGWESGAYGFMEYLERVIESCPMGIIVTDHKGRITLCNEVQVRLSGRGRAETLGKRLFACGGYAEGAREMLPLVERALADGSTSTETGVRCRWGDGREQVLNLKVQPLQLEGGGIVGTIVSVDDVTADDELQQRLRRSERLAMLGQLAAGVAHEIANPLSIVSGNLQLWHESIDEKKAIGKGDIELLLREVERCMNLTRRFRDLSCSPPAGKELVGINSLLRNIMFLMEAEFRYRRVTVRTRLGEGVPCIRGDAGRLQQLFANLVLNGVQAMRAGGVLTVETSVEEDGRVTVRVIDTGRGIPSGLIQKIFTPFFTTRQEEGGAGLGLMVVQQVLQEHGGDVNVESCPEKGTAFTVSLPAVNGSGGS